MARVAGVQKRVMGINEARLRALIAQKAHQLWEQRGCCDGRDLDDWLEAERLVRQERGVSHAHSA